MGGPVVAWVENSAIHAVIFSSSAWMPYEGALSDTGTQPASRLTGELDHFDQATLAWTRSDPAGSGTFDILLNVANR